MIPILVLLFEALLFNRFLFDGNHVIPWDFRFWHLPHAVFIADAVRDGEFPLWNPYIYCGMPFAANPQVALFYPIRLVMILIGTILGTNSLLYCLEVDWVVSMLLGGIFTYYLARELKLDKVSALVAATIYQSGAFFASQAEHLGAIEIAGWLPLVYLGILRASPGLMSAALALSMLGGFTPLTVVVFLSAGLFVLGRKGRTYAAFAASLGFSLLLSAAIVFPAAQLRALSVSRFRTDWMGTGGGRPVESLATLVYPNAFHILEPGAFTGKGDLTFMYTYCSALGLTLALIALFHARTPCVLKLLFVVSGVLMLGDSTMIGKLFFQALPGLLKDPYYPQQWLAPFTLSLALLAGAALAPLLKKHRFAAVALPIVILDLLWFNSARPMNTTTLTREPPVTKKAFVGDQRLLADVRRATLPNRMDTKGASIHWSDSAMITGVPTANGQDPMALIRYMQVRDIFCNGQRWGVYYQVEDVTSQVLSFLNVSSILTPTDLYKNESVIPRFYLVKHTQQVRSMEESIAQLRNKTWNPRDVAFVEGPASPVSSEGRVTLTAYRRNTIDLTIDSPQPAYLVTSEPNYPGWNASIDGIDVPIFNTNAAFRGLPVPPGAHRVRFHFAPKIVYWSLAISFVSWIVWLGIAIRLTAANGLGGAKSPHRVDA